MKEKRGFIGYIRQFFWNFIKSFTSIRISYLFVIVSDLLFLAVSFFGFLIFSSVISKLANPFVTTGTLTMQNSEQFLSQFYSFLYAALGILAVFLAFLLVIWSISRLSLWNLILKNKFNLHKFGRFIAGNLLWVLIWLIPFVLAFYPIFVIAKMGGPGAIQQNPPIFALSVIVFITLLFIHFTYLFYIGFSKFLKIGQAIIFSFKVGTLKIGHLILPYLAALIVFMLISVITYPVSFIHINKLEMAIWIILLFAYVAWLRSYLAHTVQSLE
jgi:hypothetical protein